MSSALWRAPPGPLSSPGCIMIMLEPISAICFWMLTLEPWPMASMVMTEPTPMMMPSMVRNDRILLAAMALSAILNRLKKFIVVVRVKKWNCGVLSRRR